MYINYYIDIVTQEKRFRMARSKSVSLTDIAQKCGVSRATVGHIMSGKKRYKFKKETEELVRRTAAELNYRPNAYASALRNQENRIILCIAGDVCRHSDMEHLKRLEYELGKRNYNLLIQFLVDLSDEMKLEFMKKTIALPAGIAIWSLGFKEKQSMEQFKEIFANAPPTLSMTEELPGTKIDYIKILWGSPTIPMAVEHFRQKGFHRIGCCNDKSELSDIFTTAARQSGLEVKNYAVSGDCHSYFSNGKEIALKLLAEKEIPEALYCISDEMVFSLVDALGKKGIRVPEDIYILGGGDSNFSRHYDPPIPVLIHDIDGLCRTAVENLVTRIEQGEVNSGSGRCVAEIGRTICEAV